MGWGHDSIRDWTAGTNDQLDLTALSGLGVREVGDLAQIIAGGNDVIAASHAGTNSITLIGVGSAADGVEFSLA
jgi:hypothetical protein